MSTKFYWGADSRWGKYQCTHTALGRLNEGLPIYPSEIEEP
ncbi:hypothetical protein [Dolichospermum circinale]|nr:hypothetical protein [Dolichospermum circinale]MDB9451611.1 hypothetical protein [Dolichospermum circinale CS-547]